MSSFDAYIGNCCKKCRLFIPRGTVNQWGYSDAGICSLKDSARYPSCYCTRAEGFEAIDEEKKKEELQEQCN